MAKLLNERNIGNVTVFDRSCRVGGKSFGYKYEGLLHELGTCYLSDGYSKPFEWFREYGLTVSRVTEPIMYLWDPKKGRSASGPVPTLPFLSYVLGKPSEVFSRIWSVLVICKYVTIWMFYWFRLQLWAYGWGLRDRALCKELAKPFDQWCDEHELAAVKRFSYRSLTVMLFGALNEIPTLYAMRWNTPSLLFSGAMDHLYECVEGFEKLWEAIAGGQDVRLNTQILSVDRVKTKTGAWKFQLTYTQRENLGITTHEGCELNELVTQSIVKAHLVQHVMEFDHIIWAVHMDEVPDYFTNIGLTEQEERLFRLFTYRCVQAQLTCVDGISWEPSHGVRVFQKGIFEIHQGHLVGMRRTADKTLKYRQQDSSARKDYAVSYQYCPCNKAQSQPEQLTLAVNPRYSSPAYARTESQKAHLSYFWPHADYERKSAEVMQSDLAEVDATIEKVVIQRRFLYNPMLQDYRIAADEMRLLEHTQGKNNIWYTGASTSFETVNNIIAYNMKLADRIQYAISVAPHAWWPRRMWFRFSRYWNHVFSLYNK
jgi:hypothetical protein